jgi:hypothetical protein
MMKLLLIASMFLLLTACNEESAKAVPIPAPMIATTVIPPVPVATTAEPAPVRTEKKVCRDVTVKGQTKSQCRVIKIHKKYDGTVVPKQGKK